MIKILPYELIQLNMITNQSVIDSCEEVFVSGNMVGYKQYYPNGVYVFSIAERIYGNNANDEYFVRLAIVSGTDPKVEYHNQVYVVYNDHCQDLGVEFQRFNNSKFIEKCNTAGEYLNITYYVADPPEMTQSGKVVKGKRRKWNQNIAVSYQVHSGRVMAIMIGRRNLLESIANNPDLLKALKENDPQIHDIISMSIVNVTE